MKKDFYQVLEVHPRARTAVIEAAYRAMMKEIHPDTGASTDGTRAVEINEAHDALTDPHERRQYDRSREVDVGKTIGQYKLLDQIAEGGYKNMMLCDELCLKEELLARAVNAFQAFKESYEGGTQVVPIRILPRTNKPLRVVPQPVKSPTSVFGKGWAWIGGRARSI